MVRATADIYAGRNPEWYPSFRFGISKFVPLIGATLLVIVAYAAVSLVTLLFFSIFMAGASTQLGFLFMLVAVLIFIMGGCAIVYIFISIIPLYPIIVIEEKGPINALHRCMELSKGRLAYLSAGVVLLVVMQYVMSHLLHAVLNGGGASDYFFSPAGAVVSFLPNVLYVPLVTM